MAIQKTIEQRGVQDVQRYFYSCDCLDSTHIAINDKDISLDGYIDIYDTANNKQFSKETLIARVWVQVKGTERSIKHNRFPIKKDDLLFYRDFSNGLLFFVDIQANNSSRLLYKKLAPLDIKEALAKLNSNKAKPRQMTVTFHSVPKDPMAFVNIIKDFSKQISIQSIQKNLDIDIKTFKKPAKELTTTISTDPRYWEETLRSGIYLYANVKLENSQETVSIPYASAEVIDLLTAQSKRIEDGTGNSLPCTIYKSSSTGAVTLCFGAENSIKIYVQGDVDQADESKKIKMSLTYTLKGTFQERIRDIQFLKNYLKKNNIDSSVDHRKWTKFESNIDFYEKNIKNILSAFKSLHISPDFDPSLLKEEEGKILNDLLKVFFGKIKPRPRFQHINFAISGNRYDFLINGNRIYNFFSTTWTKLFQIQTKNEKGQSIKLNPYIAISDNLNEYPNFSKQLIYEGFKDLSFASEKATEVYNDYVLALLKNYDQSQNKAFLDLASMVLGKVKDHIDKNTLVINRAQIEKRSSGEIPTETQEELIHITHCHNTCSRFCAFVLLGMPIEANNIWGSLESQTKKMIYNWPIYYLYNSLNK